MILFTYLWSVFFQVGREVAHPGVANDFGDEDAKKYYTYYQWVCFVLFFQVRICKLLYPHILAYLFNILI